MSARYYLERDVNAVDSKVFLVRDSARTNRVGNHVVVTRYADIARAAFCVQLANNGGRPQVGMTLPR